MITGFKSYVRKCNICELYFRYQGWNYGIHNYNDRFIFQFDVCLYLKEHLYHHNSILSFSESMNSLFNLSVPTGDIVKVYILFDLLLNNLYSFYCNICGYYPWILAMDLTKKLLLNVLLRSWRVEKNQRTPWTATNSGRMLNLMLSQMSFLIEKLKA